MTIEPLSEQAEVIWERRSGIAREQTKDLTFAQFYAIAKNAGEAFEVLVDGTAVALFGVIPATLTSQSGTLWFLGSENLGHPVRVVREMRRALSQLNYRLLYAESDCGRWLKMLDFREGDEIYWRSNNV